MRVALMLTLLAACASLHAQPAASIDLTDVILSEGMTFEGNAGPIDPGTAYRAELAIEVRGVGNTLSGAIPLETPVESLIQSTGGIPADLLVAYIDDPDGTAPSPSFERTITLTDGRPFAYEVVVSYTARVTDDSTVSLTIDTINVEPRTDSLLITSGCFTLETFDAPVPEQATEWQLDGDFESYGDNAVLRFRDDAAFTPPDPFDFDLTESLAGYGSTLEFGIAPIPGTEPVIFRVPGANDTALPAGGMGLVVWPNSASDHPDGFVDQWTIIMDLLIPASSWDGAEYIALVKFDAGSTGDADLFIQVDPPAIGTKTQVRESGAIAPDTWMRLAMVGDTSTGLTEFYINGDPLGGIDGVSPIANRLHPDTPTYANGVAITPEDFAAWGEFPNPWASDGQTQVESGYALFADNDGENRAVFVGGLFTGDQTTPAPKVAILDDPDDDRIILCQVACDADMNCDCAATVLDLLDFLTGWFDDQIDFNADLAFDVLDLLDYLAVWFGGCPDD